MRSQFGNFLREIRLVIKTRLLQTCGDFWRERRTGGSDQSEIY